MNQATLDKRIYILKLILDTYEKMPHLPGIRTSEIVNYRMILTEWIKELEKQKNSL